MVKMMTTEPTVELKLAKGGAVAMKKGGSTTKAKKMAFGGLPTSMPSMPARGAADMPAAAPKKPSMASRRKAMMAIKAPVAPVMKKGGKVHEDAAEDRAMIKKALAGKKYATGGVVKGQGGYKTGGVVNGQGGYAAGGIINTEGQGGKYRNTDVVTSHPDNSPAKTGGVKLGNAGGYKKGGKAKKFADGGAVQDDGRAVKMPQGNKRPSAPVSINELSGTFKKGGKVKKYAGGGSMSSRDQSAAYDKFYADEKAENEAEREAVFRAMKSPFETMKKLPDRLRQGYEALKNGVKGQGSVTTTEREVSRTVAPGKKRGGKAC
jgi:hypothetical protein